MILLYHHSFISHFLFSSLSLTVQISWNKHVALVGSSLDIPSAIAANRYPQSRYQARLAKQPLLTQSIASAVSIT